MSNIQVVNSNSGGNCYILDVDGDKLILEAGVKWKALLNDLFYDLNVMGVVVSHSHH